MNCFPVSSELPDTTSLQDLYKGKEPLRDWRERGEGRRGREERDGGAKRKEGEGGESD